jgi:hypothetical protein
VLLRCGYSHGEGGVCTRPLRRRSEEAARIQCGYSEACIRGGLGECGGGGLPAACAHNGRGAARRGAAHAVRCGCRAAVTSDCFVAYTVDACFSFALGTQLALVSQPSSASSRAERRAWRCTRWPSRSPCLACTPLFFNSFRSLPLAALTHTRRNGGRWRGRTWWAGKAAARAATCPWSRAPSAPTPPGRPARRRRRCSRPPRRGRAAAAPAAAAASVRRRRRGEGVCGRRQRVVGQVRR